MQEITKTQFEQFRFCKKFWDENGGAADERPVWYEASDGQGGKVQRIFISATWFSNWERWKMEADRALSAALVRYDAFHGIFEKSGTSYPIAGEPHYLLEKSGIWKDEFTIWINALCPSKEQFDLTLVEARQKIANHGKPVQGARVASVTEPLPMLPIPSEWCQGSGAGTVGAWWKK